MKVFSLLSVVLQFLAFAYATNAAFAEETSNKSHTWDNNPEGVQVFILAGQSNMVGHGKADVGHGDVKGGISPAYWGMGMEGSISPTSSVEYVDRYKPLASGFNYEELGVVPKPPSAYK